MLSGHYSSTCHCLKKKTKNKKPDVGPEAFSTGKKCWWNNGQKHNPSPSTRSSALAARACVKQQSQNDGSYTKYKHFHTWQKFWLSHPLAEKRIFFLFVKLEAQTEEREDKWMVCCNGTQIICCESMSVSVRGRSVKHKNVSTGLCCIFVGYACVRLCVDLSLKVLLRAFHSWVLRWLPAGLLGTSVSIVLSRNTPAASLGHSQVALCARASAAGTHWN